VMQTFLDGHALRIRDENGSFDAACARTVQTPVHTSAEK
jgi:hypothetical protein